MFRLVPAGNPLSAYVSPPCRNSATAYRFVKFKPLLNTINPDIMFCFLCVQEQEPRTAMSVNIAPEVDTSLSHV